MVISWALQAGLRPGAAFRHEPEDRETKELARLWRAKMAEPGFAVSGLVLVRAERNRPSRELLDHVADCRAQPARPYRRYSRDGRARQPQHGERARTTTNQVAGSASTNCCRCSASRSVMTWCPASRWGLPASCWCLPALRARDDDCSSAVTRSGARPVALSAEAALHHLAVVGPTGSGKSVVLARGVLDDLSAGYGGVLIDPKADLIDEVLNRVPAADRDRIVVLDPAAGGPVPGLDLFGAGDPDLRSEVILSVLRGISEGWGPRIDQYLRLGLRTVADLPNPVLSDWLRLYSDAGSETYRHSSRA